MRKYEPKTFLRYVRIGVLALLCSSSGIHANTLTTIDPFSTRGVWEGWGTSLCWWAQRFGTRDDVADVLFTTNNVVLNGTTLPGLGLNIARYNVGASSWNTIGTNTMQESVNIDRSRQIEGYWLDWYSTDPSSASWDWSVDENQRTMLQKARDRGVNHLELFSNSPMWWMCYNHNPSGANNGGSDNLQDWNYQNHAVYLATVAKYAKDNWGITFNSVEPINEPSATWWKADGTQEGCHFEIATQEIVIGHLRSELDARNLNSTIISASDESHYNEAVDTWNTFSTATKDIVGRVNVHGYQYENGRRDLLYDAVSATGTPLWNSEYADSDGTGLRLARNLNLDFRWLLPTAWCYWQPFDWADWGLIDADLTNGWMGQPEMKYYVLAHYTRHIRPGMTILTSDEDNTVTAYDPARRTLTIVGLNEAAAQTITYDLGQFHNVAGPVRCWTTITDSNVTYEVSDDVLMSNQQFQSDYMPNMIKTFEIQNVDIYAIPKLLIQAMDMNQALLFSWTNTASGHQLYSTEDLTVPTQWQAVTNGVVFSNGFYHVEWPMTQDPQRSFRLSFP